MSGCEDLVIGVILPDVLGTYSDAGNAVVLAHRARSRRAGVRVLQLTADSTPPATCDVYLIGGGEDTAQLFAIEWLTRHRSLRHALSTTATTFAVCAGLQILGTTLTDLQGRRHHGLGLLDLTTAPRGRRAVGEVITHCRLPGVGLLTGFENHRGATTLGPATAPLGHVLSGVGNGAPAHGSRPVEGAVTDRVLGTYLHGPVLARNPGLADHVLDRVLGHPTPGAEQPPIPDLPELRRHYLTRTPRRILRSRLRR